MKSKNKILNQIESNIDDYSFVQPQSSRSGITSIIEFIKNKLHIKSPLIYSESLDSLELFQLNDLHLRETIPSRKVPSGKIIGNMLLLITNNSKPLLQYSNLGDTYLYDPESSSTIRLKDLKNDLEVVAAYEIYRQFPHVIRNALTILKISIAGDVSKFVLIVIVSLLVMSIGLTTPILTSFLVNTVIPSSNIDLLFETLVPCLIILIVSSLMDYFQGLALLLMETSVDLKIQSAVWQKVYKLPISFFSGYTPGDLLSRINAISAIRKALGNQALLSILQLLFSFVFFVLMMVYDFELAISALVVSIISIIIIAFTIYRQTRLQLPYVEQQAELTNFANQAITGLSQIRSTNTEVFLLNQWFKRIDNSVTSQRRISFWQGLLSSFSSINQPLGTVILYALIVYRLALKSEPPSSTEIILILSSFLPFYQAYISFNFQLQRVITTIGNIIAQVLVQWDRAKPILYELEEPGFASQSIVHQINGEIEFSDVSYSFDSSSNPLFSGISFNIEKGSFTALTGESGCGKSTLMKLLLGFLEPTSGSILIDGIPLNSLNIRYYRKQLGVVLQSTKLPPGSIFDAVCSGRNFSENDVWQALEQAAIADQINQFPMGIDTILTESPSISGGQKQRIALARALISKPKILILDEATSALDVASQHTISQSINALGITRLVIAHRLSTIRDADQVLFIKNGSIYAKGTFTELDSSGLFT